MPREERVQAILSQRVRTKYTDRDRDYSLRDSEIHTQSEVGKFRVWELNCKNDLVFYNCQTGNRFVDLKAGFALACKKAKIDGVSWHTLRHTFASRLLDRGVAIVTVQQLLGHSTLAVTMRYTHTNLESKKAAVEKLVAVGDSLVTVAQKRGNKIVQLSQVHA